MRTKLLAAASAVLAMGVTATGLDAASASPSPSGPVVVASGLDNPRGLTWAANGALLVAEAGRGGSGTCLPGIFTAQWCIGTSGAITQVKRNGQQRRIVDGLPSLADPITGGFAFGPSDVSADHGRLYASVGGPADQLDRSAFSEPFASGLGTIQRVTGARTRTVADLAAYELANDPDQQLHESNAQSVLATGGRLYAIDAAGNTFFRVKQSGELILLNIFDNRVANGVEYQAVPSALAKGPDGAIYISDLTGVPFPAGESKIWRWTPSGIAVFAEGFTSAVDLAFGPDGSLYVLEIFPGQVIRVAPGGARTVVADGLNFPGGLAIGRDGAVYVSDCGVCAGAGTVLRFAG
jgi:hypothetical protein